METTAGEMAARATAFGVHAETVDGQDVRAIYEVTAELVERARRGDGPAFLLCNTYRHHGHHVGDINREYYRSKQEERLWATERDPIKLLSAWLVANKHADSAQLDRIQLEIKSEMQKAVEFAIAASYPNIDEASQDVYA